MRPRFFHVPFSAVPEVRSKFPTVATVCWVSIEYRLTLTFLTALGAVKDRTILPLLVQSL